MLNRKIYIEIKNIGNYVLQAEDDETFLTSEKEIDTSISNVIKKLLPLGEVTIISKEDLDSEEFLFLRNELNILDVLFRGINMLSVEDIVKDIQTIQKASKNIKVEKLEINGIEVWNESVGLIKKK